MNATGPSGVDMSGSMDRRAWHRCPPIKPWGVLLWSSPMLPLIPRPTSKSSPQPCHCLGLLWERAWRWAISTRIRKGDLESALYCWPHYSLPDSLLEAQTAFLSFSILKMQVLMAQFFINSCCFANLLGSCDGGAYETWSRTQKEEMWDKQTVVRGMGGWSARERKELGLELDIPRGKSQLCYLISIWSFCFFVLQFSHL